MHGLINRSIQRFITDSYGVNQWAETMFHAGFDFVDFEAMWTYEQDVTLSVLRSAAVVLNRSREELLEDIGTYIVSHPNVAAVRRLLRFGGVDFVDFLHSLDDLPDRARLAVPDLELPRLELVERDAHSFSLHCYDEFSGWGYVFSGLLRAMADDYGALAYIERREGGVGAETLQIELLESDFSVARGFELAASRK